MKGVIKPGSEEGKKLPTFKELLRGPWAREDDQGPPTPSTPPCPEYHQGDPSGAANQGAAVPQNQPVFRESINTMKHGGGQERKSRLILRLPENTMKTQQAKKGGKLPDFKESENTIKSWKGPNRPPGGRRKGRIRFYGEKLKYQERAKKKRPLRMFPRGGGEKH